MLDEFVYNIKTDPSKTMFVVRAGDIKKQMLYDFNHGNGEALKLLSRALPYMQAMYELSEKELNSLERKAKLVAKYEIWHWEYVENLPDINPSYIVIKGEGYVILKTGIRIDYGPDYYHHIRDEFHRTGVYYEGLK